MNQIDPRVMKEQRVIIIARTQEQANVISEVLKILIFPLVSNVKDNPRCFRVCEGSYVGYATLHFYKNNYEFQEYSFYEAENVLNSQTKVLVEKKAKGVYQVKLERTTI